MPSTTWDWRKVKIGALAPAGDATASEASTFCFRRGDPRLTQVLRVEWRGGPEDSWLVTWQGRPWRFPGHWCLSDVMRKLLGELPPERV